MDATLMKDLVVIEWEDSHSGRGWQDLEEIERAAIPLPCASVGWILKETPKVLLLVSTLSKDEAGHARRGIGDICIPKRCIIKRDVITIGKKRV